MGSNNIFTGKQPENKRLWGNNQSGMNLMKLKVRTCFKELHKVRKQVFAGDDHALQFIRQVIRNEFEKHKDVTDPQKIEELIKVGEEAAEYAKTHVVQLERQGDSDRFRMKLTPDHKLITNKMYDENEIIPLPRSRRRKKDSESCPSSTSDGSS